MQNDPSISVADVVDARPYTALQRRVLLLCAAVIFLEGFDAQAVGYVAPSIAKALHLAPGALGPVFSAGLFGLVVGAMFIAPLADRIGRRRVMIASTLVFGVLSLATLLANSVTSLLVIRFLTGVGLGGAMPNAIALTSEYSPRRRNGFLVMVMFAGFSLGSAGGGLVAAWFIRDFGWQSIFVAGGVLPLVLAPLLAAALPESIRFLALKPETRDAAIRLLRQIDPGLPSDARFASRGDTAAMSVGALFANGRAWGTVLLWIVFAMSLLDINLVSSWLPTALNAGGASLERSALTLSIFQFGGIVGTFALASVVDRTRPAWVLAGASVLGAVAIGLVAGADAREAGILIFAALAGFGIVGGQITANAMAAMFYPTPIRATGVGWALGVGRFGSIVGPLLGGFLLAKGVAPSQLFLFSVVPTLVAALAGACLVFARRRERPEEPAAALSAEAGDAL
jgi:AAHS family 4-hydroxybenzoate transporter-like MFS transporter